jgi:hypothetical protein
LEEIMNVRPLFHVSMAINLLLAALPLRSVRAAPLSADPADLLQFTSGGHVLGFTDQGMYAATGTHALHMDFADANRVPPQSSSPAGGGGQAAALGRVEYPDLWDGINLAYTASSGGIYTTTFTLAPGADPADIRLEYNAPPELNEDGTLTIAFETGALTESAPVAWQDIGGKRIPVDVAFRVTGVEVGFIPGEYDPDFELTIDPVLTWSTFLGGSGDDAGYAIAVDADGNAFLAGVAGTSWGTPVRAYSGGNSDVFVVKLNSSGESVWNTYLGGTGPEMVHGIAIGPGGTIYVAGTGGAWGSPIRPHSGGWDAFVAKLDADGNLVWNTCLGGGDQDYGMGIAVDSGGPVYVMGSSTSSWGSPVQAHGGGSDAFAAQLDADGNLVWNTFVGGTGNDTGRGIGKDFAGNIYLAGHSTATWGSPVRAYTAGEDAFAAKLVATTGVVTWNTFLGGAGEDRGRGITASSNGSSVYVLGEYSDAAWGSPVRAYTAGWDAFTAKLDSAGALTWNTFLGGEGDDAGAGIVVDGYGNIFVSGDSGATWGSPVRAYSSSADPHDDPFAAKLNGTGSLAWNTFLGSGWNDAGGGIAFLWSGYVFVCGTSGGSWGSPVQFHNTGREAYAAQLDDSGALLWNTFAGGAGSDEGHGIAVDGSGNVYVSGVSNAPWGSPVRPFTNDSDAFVTKLDSTGSLAWNTFLGGSGADWGKDIAVDGDGNVLVTGYSDAAWGSPVRAYGGGSHDSFAAKLSASGVLTWSTFLGGTGWDESSGVVVDGDGNAYIAGFSDAAWGSPVRPYTSSRDAFVAKLNSAGGLTWNTFVGGTSGDSGHGIDRDNDGNIYLVGKSYVSWGSPVRAFTVGDDVFVAKLSSSGALIWNTFLGGSGQDRSFGISAAVNGEKIYVSGDSDAAWGSPVRAYTGGYCDAFVAELGADGGLTWNTFLGGSDTDYAWGVDSDESGNVYVAGSSFTAWGSPAWDYTAYWDAYAVILDPSGAISSHVFLGGTGNDFGNAIVIDAGGTAYMAGSSASFSWGSPVRPYSDGSDASVARLAYSPPDSFGKTGPADGTFATTSPTLAWDASNGADYYLYCADTIDNGVCDTSWVNTGTSTAADLSGLGSTVAYYWLVAAANDEGTTYADGGTWWSFTARNQTFTDVPVNHTLWQYIEAFYASGITTGCGVSPLIYCPENNVTRAAMAVFLLRAKYGAGYTPPAARHFFADLPVAGKEWQEAWVDQFYFEGITTGCGTGPLIYCPENPVTRAAMAVFILRTLEGSSYTPPAASHFFADMPVAGKEWMEPWVDELYRRGITTGCGTGPLIFCPENPVKRQAMAAFIVRAFNLPLP